MSGGEEENSDEREGSPEVAILEQRQDIGCGHGESGNNSEYGGCNRDDLHPVDRARDLGLWNGGGELARDPGVDLFGGLRTVKCQLVRLDESLVIAYPDVKS